MKKDLIRKVTGLALMACIYFPGHATPLSNVYSNATYSSAEILLSFNSMQGRVEVKVEDLPEKVRNTLNDKSYAGWTIIEAFLVTNEDNSQYYELVVRRADERTRMKVDANGNVLN